MFSRFPSRPACTAASSGGASWSACVSAAIPPASNASSMSVSPRVAASTKAVWPRWSVRRGLACAARRARALATAFACNATCSSVSPWATRLSGSAPSGDGLLHALDIVACDREGERRTSHGRCRPDAPHRTFPCCPAWRHARRGPSHPACATRRRLISIDAERRVKGGVVAAVGGSQRRAGLGQRADGVGAIRAGGIEKRGPLLLVRGIDGCATREQQRRAGLDPGVLPPASTA